MPEPNNDITLFNYYQKRSNAFFKRLDQTQRDCGVEDIHQLRVEIKKMRAILKLLEIVSNHMFNQNEHLNALLVLFKSAGTLREIQMNLSIVSLYPPTPFKAFKIHLLHEEEEAFENFRIILGAFDKEQFQINNAKIEPHLANISNENIHEESIKFIVKKAELVDKLMQVFHLKKSPHKIRIHLKAIAAVAKLTHELFPDKKLKKLVKDIKPVMELIGDWHDSYILLETMKTFKEKNDLFQYYLEFHTLIKKLKFSHKGMLLEIRRELNEILPFSLPEVKKTDITNPNQESEIFYNV